MPIGSQSLSEGEKACVIGAGLSGLAAARTLKKREVPYDQFEMGSSVGGLWRIGHESGRSAAYDNLCAITSKESMALEGHPFPDEVPTFPHHEHVRAYAESYADRFGLRDQIAFNTQVDEVVPTEDTGHSWAVTPAGGQPRTYGAVLVATGHHWCPRWPEVAGTFAGPERHARDYRSPEAFAGDRVLVVGIGNTGTGIASDLCRLADKTVLSARTPAWIMPKYLLGRPLDQWSGPYMERLPVWMRRWTLQALRWLTVGRQERYGVPTPEHRPLEEHPTLSEEFLAHVDHGRIAMRPGIDHIEGRRVTFADGQAERFDAILYATGYEVSFPFLPDRVFQVGPEEIGLYRYVVAPGQPGLYFLGLVQPAGPLPPLSERQSRWVADLLTGTAALPPAGSMRGWIQKERERRRRRYHDSPRHRLEVDYWDYVRQIENERAEGRRRT